MSRVFLAFTLIVLGIYQSKSHAIAAFDISISPLISTNGSFTVSWNFYEGPDTSCLSFDIEVTRVGGGFSGGGYTTDCYSTSFSGNGYPDGEYDVVVATNYERHFESGGSSTEYYASNPVRFIVSRPIPSSDLAEGFEANFGSWENVGQFSWLRKSGRTPSAQTGPEAAAQEDYYAYFETSSGAAYVQGNNAILQSGTVNITKEELHFKYQMYGSDTGSLYVEIFQDGIWNTLWSKSGQQQKSYASPWEDVWIPLSTYRGPARLRLRAVAAGGYMGDIAIDDITIRNPSGSIVTEFKYDVLGRLVNVSEDGEVREGYKYDRAGNFCDVAAENLGSESYCE